MEAYRYKAINAQGRVSQGRVDAVNPADLETRLARMGLDLVNYRELPSRNRNVTGRGIEVGRILQERNLNDWFRGGRTSIDDMQCLPN